jgi:multiple sugar transport system substrate-binding protein
MVPTFVTGKIGMMACGNFCIPPFKEGAKFDFGNTLIPGQNGGQASFGGGDVLSISASSGNQDAAWEYVRWVLSKDTQVEAIAKNGYMVDRTDLANNRYAGDLVKLQNKALTVAQTPKTLGYNEIFNNPNGPWGNMINSAIFRGNVQAAMSQAQQRTQQILEESGAGSK